MPLPPSKTCLPINLVGLASFIGVLVFFSQTPDVAPSEMAAVAIAAFVLPIAALELFVLRTHRRPSTGLDFGRAPHPSPQRVAVKLAGFYGTLATIAAAYWLIPEYGREDYEPFWQAARAAWPLVAIGAAAYFAAIDRYMLEPRDGYWHAGLLFLGRWDEIDTAILRRHALEWVIKAFFLPLMFVQLTHLIVALTAFEYDKSFLGHYVALYDFLYAADLVVATSGYIVTLRVLDSHICSVDRTPGGWFVAIICYGPFWVFAYAALFNYERNGTSWGPWLVGYPVLQWAWGIAILVLTALYVGAHLTFGLRFSNLTNRGIVTNGLYALTKHPAYLAKNASWWLVSIPFIATTGWPDTLRNCLLLLAVNAIYVLRARTEERHLSRDPDYVAYATAMNHHSIFAGLGRVFPMLRYGAPAASSTLETPVISIRR